MIKRPLVVILMGYLAGMYLAWHGLLTAIVFFLTAVGYIIIYLLMFRIKQKESFQKEYFLWCLPVFLLFGYLTMEEQLKRPDADYAFDREVSCELSGSIAMIVRKTSSTALYVKDNCLLLPGGGQYRCEYIIVYVPDSIIKAADTPVNYLTGNKITVQGTLQKFSAAANPGQFNEQLYYQIENIDYKMQADRITITDTDYSLYHAVLSSLKDSLVRVYDTMLSGKEAGAMIAMLLGEKHLLDDGVRKLYQQNGISHILAISGLHVSLIGMFFYTMLKRCRVPIPAAALLSAFIVYSYGVLTNFSVSTNRAVVMMCIMLFATLAGKTYDMLSALSLSALVILLQNPLQLLSAGFLLSFGAILGIAILLPALRGLIPAKNPIIDGFLVSLSAQIATTPVILWFFYQFPVYGVFTNLIILPFVTVLTLSSFLAGIAGMICLPAGVFLIGGANYILKFYEWVCRMGSGIPGNLITTGRPEPFQLFLYAFLITGFLWAVRKYRKKYLLLIPGAALLLLLLPERNAGLEITFIDVGQGDAIYMESGTGTRYLVDGGSSSIKDVGIYRLKPFLLFRGTDTLDYAIVTHSDSDHVNGLMQLMEEGEIRIKTLLLPLVEAKDEAYGELEALAGQKGTTLGYIRAGDVLKDGKLRMFCLHPGTGFHPSSANSYSTVLSVAYGEFDALLTGDLEKGGEELVVNRLGKGHTDWTRFQEFPAIRYEVLKVAHHGSKTSSSEEFLRAVHPLVSVISCGEDNVYGHPHQEVLDRLKRIGSDIRITYGTGAVTIRTDGRSYSLVSYKKDSGMIKPESE